MKRKMFMKNRRWICLLLSVVMLLAGCSGKGSGQPAGNSGSMDSSAQTGDTTDAAVIERMMAGGVYDVEMEEKKLASPLQEGEPFLGAQYYDGERLWYIGNEEGQVFCYHEEQGERELLLEEVQQTRRSKLCKWLRDEERFYILNSISLLVLDTDGEKIYETSPEESIRDIALTKEGDVVLVTENRSRYDYVLKTLNPETGALSGGYALSECFGIAEGAVKGVLVMDLSGVYDLDVESGEKIWYMRWSGTSYSPNINSNPFYAIQITEDGSMEMLQGRLLKEEYYAVSIKKINPDEMDKIPLVFRVAYANSGLKLLVARFNQQNQEYHVFLQDRSGENYGDFVARTDMEIATGKGPDMFEDDAVSDIYALAAKGALENLEPYFVQSTIDRNDYHPAAFQNLGREEGIYGVGYEMCADTMYIREELTAGSQEMGLVALLGNMESYDGAMIFNSSDFYASDALLRYFLWMSEDFYGMVDWEQKTCDFSGELWEKILRVSKVYGMTDRNREIEFSASEEMLDRFWECMDNAKPVPHRTEQVIAIIQEEAEFYFTGDKTIEEISAIIENRVKLYLAEME